MATDDSGEPVAESRAGGDPTDLPQIDKASLEALLGPRLDVVTHFGNLLVEHGEERGLIGPREVERLWERHLLNSAAVVPFLGEGVIVDVGSGAGLPGIVIAAVLPEREVVLIEPMERRVAWLEEVAAELGLDKVRVLRGRAEEYHGALEAGVVTARAVAAVDKLIKWCAPLLAPGGHMALLKGRSAPDEIERAKYALRKARLTAAVVEAPTLAGLEPTTVVTLSRDGR